MKKIILLLLIITILAGCTGIASNTTYKQAQGTVILDDQEYTMAVGEFEWREEDFQFRKISNAEIHEQTEEFDTLQGEQGGKLKIKIDQNPSSISIHQLSEDHSRAIVELKDNEMTLPRKAGYYIYEVNVVWDHGRATYLFDVSIE